MKHPTDDEVIDLRTDPDNDLIPIFIGVFMDHIRLASPTNGVHIDLTAEQARAIGRGLMKAADILDDIDDSMLKGGTN